MQEEGLQGNIVLDDEAVAEQPKTVPNTRVQDIRQLNTLDEPVCDTIVRDPHSMFRNEMSQEFGTS